MWVSVHCEGDLFQMARMSCESSSCTTKETCLQGIHNLNHSGVESFCCKKKTAIFFLNTILFPPPSFSFKERQWCPNSGRLSTCPWFIYANLRNGFSHVFHRSVWMKATGPPFFRVGEKGSERWWIVVYSNPLKKKKKAREILLAIAGGQGNRSGSPKTTPPCLNSIRSPYPPKPEHCAHISFAHLLFTECGTCRLCVLQKRNRGWNLSKSPWCLNCPAQTFRANWCFTIWSLRILHIIRKHNIKSSYE